MSNNTQTMDTKISRIKAWSHYQMVRDNPGHYTEAERTDAESELEKMMTNADYIGGSR